MFPSGEELIENAWKWDAYEKKRWLDETVVHYIWKWNRISFPLTIFLSVQEATLVPVLSCDVTVCLTKLGPKPLWSKEKTSFPPKREALFVLFSVPKRHPILVKLPPLCVKANLLCSYHHLQLSFLVFFCGFSRGGLAAVTFCFCHTFQTWNLIHSATLQGSLCYGLE